MVSSINFKGTNISFRIKGHGKTIVLLHGFLETSKMWSKFQDVLSNEYNVIAIDLPGFGKSGNIDSIHTMELMSEAVNKVLNSLEIKKCLVVGHSMGGYVALSFAEQFASKVRGLVLFHSHALPDTSEAKVNRNRTIKVVESNHHNFIRNFIPALFTPGNAETFNIEMNKLISHAGKNSPEGIIAALEGMKMRSGKEHVLTNANFPILFIIGKEDPRIPAETIMQQVMLPKHSETLILSDTAHMGFIEARKQTISAIKGMADRVL